MDTVQQVIPLPPMTPRPSRSRKATQGPAVGKIVYTADHYRVRREGRLPELYGWKIIRDMPTYVDVESQDPRCAQWKRCQRFSKSDRTVRLYDTPAQAYEAALKEADADVVRETEELKRAREDLAKAKHVRKHLRAAVRAARVAK